MRRCAFVAAAAVCLVAGFHRPAEACIPIPNADAVAEMQGRRGAIWLEQDTFDIVFQNQTKVDAQDFAWVIPLPGVPDDVADAGEEFFDNLDAATAPMIEQSRCEQTCGPVDGGSQTGAANGMGVTVWGSGALGDLEYTVVSSDSSVELITWLQSHGYNLDTTLTTVIDDYIARGFVFFASRVAQAAVQTEPISVPSVRFTFDRASVPVVYPMVISAHKRTEPLDTTLWVIAADGPHVPSNYPYTAMSALNYADEATYLQDLEAAMAADNGRTFAIQYADRGFDAERHMLNLALPEFENLHVVRMRAHLNPVGMTSDLELERTDLTVPGWYKTGCPDGIEPCRDAGAAGTGGSAGSSAAGAPASGSAGDDDGGCSMATSGREPVSIAALLGLFGLLWAARKSLSSRR